MRTSALKGRGELRDQPRTTRAFLLRPALVRPTAGGIFVQLEPDALAVAARVHAPRPGEQLHQDQAPPGRGEFAGSALVRQVVAAVRDLGAQAAGARGAGDLGDQERVAVAQDLVDAWGAESQPQWYSKAADPLPRGFRQV